MRNKPCFRFLIVPLLLLGTLAGCEPPKRTATEDQMLVYGQSMRFAGVRLNNCVRRAQADPSFTAVRAHFALPSDSPTDEQLADNTLPTAEDVANLRRYFPLQEKCRTAFIAEVERVSPMEATYYGEYLGDLDAILNDLIERKMTWGESVKRRKELVENNDEKRGLVHDKMAAEWQKQHRKERQQGRMGEADSAE